jgi:hypothetical protein
VTDIGFTACYFALYKMQSRILVSKIMDGNEAVFFIDIQLSGVIILTGNSSQAVLCNVACGEKIYIV